MSLLNDLRFAWRSLAKNPFFSIIVILILGLGMGAATALVDFTNLLAWRLVPAEKPQELVRVYTGHLRGFAGPWGFTSYVDYVDYQESAESFTSLAAHRDVDLRLDTGDDTRSRTAGAVTGNFFATHGLKPSQGRLFQSADDQVGAAPVTVLSHHLWTYLGADPNIVGTAMKIEGIPFVVVGVGPEGYKSDIAGTVFDFFVPLQLLPSLGEGEDLLTDREQVRFSLTGRLAQGRSRADAHAEMTLIAKRLDEQFPMRDNKPRRISTSAALIGHPIDLHRLKPSLRLFAIAVALLLAITCANIAHLLLARAVSRRREMGVRQALGAGRGLLIRQLLMENLLLAVAGGVCGLLFAWWARAYVVSFAGAAFADQMRFDARVLAGAFALCLLATLLFGLAPALATSRVRLREALHANDSDGASRRSGIWLAGAQIALSVILLSAGALLGLSLQNRLGADLGFDDDDVLIAALSLPGNEYTAEQGRLFYEQLRDRAEAIPGVEKAARTLLMPPLLFDITVPFRLSEEAESERTSRINYVDPHYFDTMGITLERGRGIESSDTVDSAPVLVINRAMAQELWPDSDPIGRTLVLDGGREGDVGPDFTVVGVVSNVDQFRASFGGEPILYFSSAQKYRPRQQLVLKSRADPEMVFAALRDVVREMDPGLAISDARTGRANREFAFSFERMQVVAVGIFAVAGLLLSVLGLFAVLSYGVSRRTRAIGIRMAIGARATDIRRQVVAQGLWMTAAGSFFGLVALLAASKYLEQLLFGVGVGDLRILGAVVVTVLLTAMLAAYLPARRASRLDPLVALRHE